MLWERAKMGGGGQEAWDFDSGLVDPKQRRLMNTKRGDGSVSNTGVHAHAEPLLGCRAGLGLDA